MLLTTLWSLEHWGRVYKYCLTSRESSTCYLRICQCGFGKHRNCAGNKGWQTDLSDFHSELHSLVYLASVVVVHSYWRFGRHCIPTSNLSSLQDKMVTRRKLWGSSAVWTVLLGSVRLLRIHSSPDHCWSDKSCILWSISVPLNVHFSVEANLLLGHYYA